MVDTVFAEAWHVVMTSDPLEESDDEMDENTRLDLRECALRSTVPCPLTLRSPPSQDHQPTAWQGAHARARARPAALIYVLSLSHLTPSLD